MEIWKPLHKYPGYEGSTEGRIKNVRTQKIQKPTQTENNCLKVSLYKNGHRHTVKLHRVIAKTFLGDHPGMDVRHKDGDYTNNSVDNLEWCTRSDVVKSSYLKGNKKPPKSKIL